MPGERLLDGRDLGLCGSLLSEAASETGSHFCLLIDSLYLLAVLRYDGLLTFEVLDGKVLTQIAVGEDGVAAVGLVEGLEDEPATDEAVVVGLCRSGSDR